MNKRTYARGDVVLLPFPYISDYTQSKSRPAVVIQNNVANRYSPNLIVALISSTAPKKSYPMHYRIEANSPIGHAAGLHRDSIVKAEVILTIPGKIVIQKIGALPSEAMKGIDASLRVSLAL